MVFYVASLISLLFFCSNAFVSFLMIVLYRRGILG